MSTGDERESQYAAYRFVLLVSFLVVVVALCAAAGFALGEGSATTTQQALAAKNQAWDSSARQARRKGRSEGFAQGRRQGRREGRRLGRSRGEAAGRRAGENEAARREQEQAQSQQVTQDDIWCDTDGYCLQKSPGAGGPPCPPNTVENAGGVVCVPNALIKP